MVFKSFMFCNGKDGTEHYPQIYHHKALHQLATGGNPHLSIYVIIPPNDNNLIGICQHSSHNPHQIAKIKMTIKIVFSLFDTWNQRMAITTLDACSITYPHIWTWCNYIFSCDYTYYTINITWLQPLCVCVSSLVSQLHTPGENICLWLQ